MNRQDKEFRLIQKGMYSGDLITSKDISELSKIQNEKALEFLKKYPNAVAGKINWHKEEDKEFPFLKDQGFVGNPTFNFALPERVKMIELALKSWNETEFEAKIAMIHLEKINAWIRDAKGMQFFWLWGSRDKINRDWLPTGKNIEALPWPVQKYIADVETNADPPSMVADNIILRDTIKALEIKLEQKPGITEEWIDRLIWTIEGEATRKEKIKRAKQMLKEVDMEVKDGKD